MEDASRPVLRGKVVLVTGGGSGIGRATALAAARHGARVAVADVDVEGGQAVAEEVVAAARGEARFFRCDVRRADQVDAMVADVVAAFGSLNGAFNAAGVLGPWATLAEASEADFDDVVATNLKGTFLCQRAELRVMLAAGAGAIVNCSSVAGTSGFAEAGPYSATKHGILGLTRTAALECAKRGVRVNAVCPGAVLTPMLERAAEGDDVAAFGKAHPVGRLGRPEEVAAAVVWLLGDDASFVTGHALMVDGGLSAL